MAAMNKIVFATPFGTRTASGNTGIKRSRPLVYLLALGLSALLGACGGSGGGSATETPIQAVVLKGVIEDGKIAGATVFLDLNGNKIRDEGEPESSESDGDGNFSLSVPKNLNLTEAELARAMLVANVPPTARDRDDNGKTLAEAGKAGFTYLAPAAAALSTSGPGTLQALRNEIPVNPVTSLVANEVLNGGHASLEAAAQAVTSTHTPLQGKDPFARFTDGRDPTVAAYAKALTVRLAEIRQQIVDEAKKEATAIAEEEARLESLAPSQTAGSSPETARQAVARAEAAITTGTAARDAALAAIAQVASERQQLANAVNAVLPPELAAAKALPPAELEQKLRETLDANRKTEAAAPSVPPPPQRMPEAVARAAAAATATRVRYIIVFRNHIDPAANNGEREQILKSPVGLAAGARLEFAYQAALRGFAVSLPAAAADAFLEAMANNPNVDRVEADSIVSRHVYTQLAAPWGLDRSDQRTLPLDTSFKWTASGTGVTAFVVDTGILATHNYFSGRVLNGYTAINDGRGTEDCNGHGTHVAGTLGGSETGIAKSVTLVPVRVLDCTGSGALSGVIAGLDWVVANARPRSVINLSLGGAASTTLDQAVANAVARGITVVVAAGNSSANACGYSPARVTEAITVGATTSSDQRASFSNYGACLDLFAPGEGIRSAWYTGPTATATLSGTSMASPHVAGVVAQLLESASDTSPAAITRALIAATTSGAVTNAGTDSPNRLLFSDSTSSSTDPGTPTPTTAVAIASLSASAIKQRNGWVAQVAVKIRRADGTPAVAAKVTGDFTVGGKALSCTTDASGGCVLASGVIPGKVVSVDWLVTSLSGSGYTYDPAANSVSSVTISRPR